MQLSKLLILGLAAVAIASGDEIDKKKKKPKHHKGVGCALQGTPPVCLITECPAGTHQCGKARKCAGGNCCTVGSLLNCCKVCPSTRSLQDLEKDEVEVEEQEARSLDAELEENMEEEE